MHFRKIKTHSELEKENQVLQETNTAQGTEIYLTDKTQPFYGSDNKKGEYELRLEKSK